MLRYAEGSFRVPEWAHQAQISSVTQLLEDSGGDLWIGTSRGLYRVHGGTARGYRRASAGTIASLIEARNGGIWAGTLGAGLRLVRNWKTVPFEGSKGINDDDVMALIEDHDGSLWIGTDGGGVNRLKKGHVKVFSLKEGLLDKSMGNRRRSPRNIVAGHDGRRTGSPPERDNRILYDREWLFERLRHGSAGGSRGQSLDRNPRWRTGPAQGSRRTFSDRGQWPVQK